MTASEATNAVPEMFDVVIVGAGLSGLSAAHVLRDAGLSVVNVDKGRSVGGRLATRRIGEAKLDHGAQFFTVRSDAFARFVADAEADGIVHVWTHGFGSEADGYPRRAGSDGMNGVAKWMARDLDVRCGVHLTSVDRADGGWQLQSADHTFSATQVIMTPPMPQTLALLGDDVPADVAELLESIEYHPVLALLATFETDPGFPAPGGQQLSEGPFSFIGDNASKGISPTPALTFHLNHALSREYFDGDDERSRAALIDWATPWFGDAEPVELQLKKWRYAGPVAPRAEATVVAGRAGQRIAFAGDAFAGAKVEGAWTSGAAAAEALMDEMD